MTDELYIWIPRWGDFQTYQKKRGKPWAPPWIRVYLHLLDDPDYLRLTDVQRGLLHDLWLMFALSHTYLPLDLKMLNRRLQRSDKMVSYERLNHAGWIEFCSRTVLEQKRNMFRNSSALEVEEKRTEQPVPAPVPEANYDGAGAGDGDDINFDEPNSSTLQRRLAEEIAQRSEAMNR